MKTALMLVDIQEDYFPGGKMELLGTKRASEGAGRLLGVFREKALPLVHVQHISIHKGATFLLPDTEGVNFHEGVRPLSNERIVIKHYPNSFRGTELGTLLKRDGIEQLIICGMMTHMCIDATVRAAFDEGFKCIVAHNACTTKNLSFDDVNVPADYVHASFMAALGTVYAKIMSVHEITESLDRLITVG